MIKQSELYCSPQQKTETERIKAPLTKKRRKEVFFNGLNSLRVGKLLYYNSGYKRIMIIDNNNGSKLYYVLFLAFFQRLSGTCFAFSFPYPTEVNCSYNIFSEYLSCYSGPSYPCPSFLFVFIQSIVWLTHGISYSHFRFATYSLTFTSLKPLCQVLCLTFFSPLLLVFWLVSPLCL